MTQTEQQSTDEQCELTVAVDDTVEFEYDSIYTDDDVQVEATVLGRWADDLVVVEGRYRRGRRAARTRALRLDPDAGTVRATDAMHVRAGPADQVRWKEGYAVDGEPRESSRPQFVSWQRIGSDFTTPVCAEGDDD